MIELLLSVVGQRGVDALAFLLAFALTALMDSVFRDRLPHDHGREFAVNGALSKGKARGSGLIFVLCIALVSMAFLPFKVEYVIYTVLLIASMLSGCDRHCRTGSRTSAAVHARFGYNRLGISRTDASHRLLSDRTGVGCTACFCMRRRPT